MAAVDLPTLVRDQHVMRFDALRLDSGQVLRAVPLAYKTWGRLNATADNVMVVCHALSGTCDVGDWWGPLLGRGRVFDPDVFFIVCCNVLGSPYGTASPLTPDPATGRPYGADFPVVTVRDTVRLQRMLLDALGVRRVQVVLGGSLGGMQALEWAFFGHEYVRAIVPIATCGRHSAWCIAWGEAQRMAIASDANWAGGRYTHDKQPTAGLAAARVTAMLTYRSQRSFATRFGRRLQVPDGTPPREASGLAGRYDPAKDLFSAQSYVFYQGKKFTDRFDANCYVRITQMIDTYDVSSGRGEYLEVLRSIKQPTLVVGIDSDGLFVPQEQHELADNIPNAHLVMIASPDGHDGFLLESRRMNEVVTTWLRATMPELYAAAAHMAASTSGEEGVSLADEAVEALKNRRTVVGEDWRAP